MIDCIEREKKRFGKLLSKVNLPPPGTYEIEVDRVLGRGWYLVQPEVAIIKDTLGRFWEIPEDQHCDDLPRLVSRYDVAKGTKLHVVVAEEDGERKITDVIVLAK